MPRLFDGAEFDPDVMLGVPVLEGTWVPVAEVLVMLSRGRTVPEIARHFDIHAVLIRRGRRGLAASLEVPTVATAEAHES